MRTTYASSRLKRKSFYRKSELQMFLLIFRGHICVPQLSTNPSWGGGVLPYLGYIGMCRCEGYGFQAVYSRIGYINQSVWV